MSIAQIFELIFLKKDRLTKDVSSFFFQRPAELDFLPGQFMRLTLEIQNPDERGNSRFFSISSSPSEKDFLMITTKSNHSAFKTTLFSLPTGAKVRIQAPYGVFTLKPEEAPHIFLAGGIGITPFRSMIRYASDIKLNIPITIFTSFRTVEDVLFQKEFRDIVDKNTWFKLVETITQPEESDLPWEGFVGRIDANIIKKNVPDFSSSLFYVAGPPAMVDGMVNLVKSLGVEDVRIRREKFTGY